MLSSFNYLLASSFADLIKEAREKREAAKRKQCDDHAKENHITADEPK